MIERVSLYCSLTLSPYLSLHLSLYLSLSLCIGLGMMLSASAPLYAQSDLPSEATEYIIVAGDTLSGIAEHYGLSVDVIAAANGIDDPSLIQIGRRLVIPTADGSLPIESIQTVNIYAQPGDTPATVAQRVSQEQTLIAALNNSSEEKRFFPGEPVAVAADAIAAEPLRLGAITSISYPNELSQGHVGLLEVESRRPISLAVQFAGTQLTLFAASSSNTAESRYWTLLPTPALQPEGETFLQLRYVASNEIEIRRELSLEVTSGGYANQQVFVPDEKSALLAPDVIQSEETLLAPIWSAVTTPFHVHAASGFVIPIGEQYVSTSGFGDRRTYNGGVLQNFHSGQDFGASEGVTVTAPLTGTVALAALLDIRGNAVVIDHGHGLLTGYWHLSEIHIELGQSVSPGESIGLVGTTGRSTGPHLHWELRIFGVAVDPMQFLEAFNEDKDLFSPFVSR